MVAIRYSQVSIDDRRSKRSSRAPGAHQRLLDDVLGVLGRAEHPVGVHLERAPVRLDQLAKRALVAGLREREHPRLVVGFEGGRGQGVGSRAIHTFRRRPPRKLIGQFAAHPASKRVMALKPHPMEDAMTNPATRRWTVFLTAIGSVMAALDTLVVASALNTIRLDLGAELDQLEWTVNAYNLSFAVLLITGAALGDRLGRRRMFAVGLTLFAVASAACALAPSAGVLIAARAIQGAGAALVLPLGFALLSAAFPPDKRGVAIGMFSAITGIAVALGPLVGGAVVEGIAWEWVFWINVPIGLVAAPLVLRKMRESHGAESGLDLRGLALISGGALRGRLGPGPRQRGGVGERRGARRPHRRARARRGLRRLGAARAGADDADALLPQPRLRGRQRGGVLHLRAAVRLRVPVRAVPADRARLRPLETGLRLMPWTITFILVAPAAGALADRIGERLLMVERARAERGRARRGWR